MTPRRVVGERLPEKPENQPVGLKKTKTSEESCAEDTAEVGEEKIMATDLRIIGIPFAELK